MTTIDLKLYRQLAADGNANAQAIVDAHGAVPTVAMDEGGSESDATDELVQFAQKVGAYKAQADILAAAGNHKAAADIHMKRAWEFDWRDQTGEAMRAYRDAANEYSKHADEACSQLTAEQVKAWHAKSGQKKTGDGEGCVCGCHGCECGCERGGTCVCSSRCPHAGG